MAIKPLPRKVSYTERDNKTKRKGMVTQVVFVEESYPWGDYRKEAQLIVWKDGGKAIRLAYYVKNHGAPKRDYHWGSQTTIILRIHSAKKLFREIHKLIGS